MIMKQELTNRIREYFDLNIYETKVWLALLSKGMASAGEVAEISGVPRSRTYDVLESLEKRGFAIIKIGKPVKYIAVKPTEVIEKMKANAMNFAQEKVKSLSALKSTQEYAELELLHKTGISPIRPQDITGSLKGRTNILARLRELFDNAEKEIFICTSVQDFESKGRVLIPVLEKAVKKNMKVKVALSGEPDKIKKINGKYDFKIKQINSPARLFMVDKKEVLFMITSPTSEEEIGIWLNSPFFTESLLNVIESSLKNGIPVEAR